MQGAGAHIVGAQELNIVKVKESGNAQIVDTKTRDMQKTKEAQQQSIVEVKKPKTVLFEEQPEGKKETIGS